MGIDCKGMVMKWVLAALLVASVMGASPEEELDKLALHVEHYPHAQGSNHAIYQFQIDNNNQNDKSTEPVDFTAEISPDMDVQTLTFSVRNLVKLHRKKAAKLGKGVLLPKRKSPRNFRVQKSLFQSSSDV